MREVNKYTQMSLSPQSYVFQTYGNDTYESGQLLPHEQSPSGRSDTTFNASERIPGGILKKPNNNISQQPRSTPQSVSIASNSDSMNSRQPFLSTQNNQNVSTVSYSNSYRPNEAFYPVEVNPHPYRPTSVPSEASFSTKKTYDRLADVYSESGDTTQFAHNFLTFLDDNVPTFIWIMFLLVQLIFGFIILLVGAFEYPFCNAQPMIPLYLVISGCLLIVNSFVRMIAHFPTGSHIQRRSKLMQTLCLYGVEGMIFLAIVVITILGCVWVYGAKYYVHYDEGMFEEHYCDWNLYWFAWWNVTLHLAVFGLIIIAFIVVLAYGVFTD